MMRRGRCGFVGGGLLISLALFNFYTMMTTYHQHTCSTEGTKAFTSEHDSPQGKNFFPRETRGNTRTDGYRGRDRSVDDRWPHRGWNGGDQMAGLVAPAEMRREVEGQLGVEGVQHKHTPHDAESLFHPLSATMTLISENNNTKHEWPWPNALSTQKLCENMNWGPLEELPTVSVIIVFHEAETLSHLLRTVHSVVQRTPRILLKQIVLVADNVQKDDLMNPLDVYIKSVFSTGLIELVRSKIWLGAIKARLLGMRHAAADVLVYIDSHMEVQHHWLEPLLYEIKTDRRTLATSFLDWFEATDVPNQWKYRHGESNWITYFDWRFTFGFQELGSALDKRASPTEAVSSPLTIGGMFAIEKKFFLDIRGFDSGMTQWGGENLDVSFRVWMCGGRVVNVPCSHSAHHESPTSRSYRDSWTNARDNNYQRVAEALLGPYKKYFYDNYPQLKNKPTGDLSGRMLPSWCKRSFEWVLKNVTPQLGIPDVDSIAYGGLENVGYTGQCLDLRDLRRPGLNNCLKDGNLQAQNFFWSRRGRLREAMHMVNVISGGSEGELVLHEHTNMYNTTKGTVWFHIKDSFLVDTSSGKCLQAETSRDLIMQPCDHSQKRQRWRFRNYNSAYDTIMNNQLTPLVDPAALSAFSAYSHLQRKRHRPKGSRNQ